MRRLRQMQQQSGGSGGGGGAPRMPRNSAALIAGSALLFAGTYFFSNALFNVDGGHRAIKYKRLSGVSKEIYSEGQFEPLSCLPALEVVEAGEAVQLRGNMLLTDSDAL